MGNTENIQEITTQKIKTEKIVEILNAERTRIAEEKKREWEKAEINKTIARKEQEAIEKREQIKKRWGMYRWCTE